MNFGPVNGKMFPPSHRDVVGSIPTTGTRQSSDMSTKRWGIGGGGLASC